MDISDNDFSVDKIKQEYKLLGGSKFYEIYDEFNKNCNVYLGDGAISCYQGNLDDYSRDTEVSILLKELYSNLYRIYHTILNYGNDYFDGSEEAKNMGYIYLKYWLYDKITKQDLKDTQIQMIFDGWKKYIKDHIQYKPKNSCILYKLNKDEIKKMKKIYALNTILHASDNDLETCDNNECKYMDYFEETLSEFINSIKKCSSDSSNDEYCKEFNDFLKICNGDNTYAGVSAYNQPRENSGDSNRKHLLYLEKYNDKPLYIYIKNNKWLNWGKISQILNPQNSTTIAATSIAGSAIGLSSIFYYLYKFTPFGSSLRKGNRKNIVNNDEEAQNSLLYKSDTDQAPFKNREYKVTYHTFSDT
ncbi:unnamed protein product [Plasmodium vivax]|uniref:(malaria parasite P. vivax) hypothetical protein n=1 Tax=Plasmodium vivax TaxID=5855 RepID=A0A8S4HFW1_PLAVI|nr:unnamed protein product [Plasmodium vivax]